MERNLLAFQTPGITRAIPAFMVVQDGGDNMAQVFDSNDEKRPFERVLADQGFFS